MTPTLGARLRELRQHRRMSQTDLASAAGVSIDLVRKLEQNQRLTARLDTVAHLADALAVAPADLLGVPRGLPGENQADVRRLRAAIYDRTADVDDAPQVGELTTATADLWSLYWAGRFAQLVQALPAHLSAARAAVRAATGDRRPVHRMLAETLQLAGAVVAHLAYEDLAQVALLEALAAANEADDPLLRATQQASQVWVLSRQGLWAQAERLAATAAADIEPVLSTASPEQIAVWGELLHFGTIALARERRDAEAHELLGLVRAAGEAVGRRQVSANSLPGLPGFGATFAAHSAVGVAMATGQPREALRLGEQVQHVEDLPRTVRSRYLLNIAYAQAMEWRSREALDTLRRVEELTPELLVHHGLARAVVEELLPRRRTEKLPGLVRIAERVGVPTT